MSVEFIVPAGKPAVVGTRSLCDTMLIRYVIFEFLSVLFVPNIQIAARHKKRQEVEDAVLHQWTHVKMDSGQEQRTP